MLHCSKSPPNIYAHSYAQYLPITPNILLLYSALDSQENNWLEHYLFRKEK